VIALLTERLGADVVDALEGLMDERIRASAVTKDEYREILSRLDLMENNYQHLSGEVSELKNEIAELRREMLEFAREMSDRLDGINMRIDSMIRWTVGTVALFGVLISALMTILKLFG
jgi:predicted RNase H-like nuclease (RuvC/YqgF family)